jgi:hypothetical protein
VTTEGTLIARVESLEADLMINNDWTIQALTTPNSSSPHKRSMWLQVP